MSAASCIVPSSRDTAQTDLNELRRQIKDIRDCVEAPAPIDSTETRVPGLNALQTGFENGHRADTLLERAALIIARIQPQLADPAFAKELENYTRWARVPFPGWNQNHSVSMQAFLAIDPNNSSPRDFGVFVKTD